LILRARHEIQSPNKNEAYGIGVNFAPNPYSDAKWWPIKIQGVHTTSAAAASGLIRGDLVIAVDGQPIQNWSSDGTYGGLNDTKTQLVRGFSGPKNSSVRLKIRRHEDAELKEFEVVVDRNIWSARHLGTPNNTPWWDGTEKKDPSIKPISKMKKSPWAK